MVSNRSCKRCAGSATCCNSAGGNAAIRGCIFSKRCMSPAIPSTASVRGAVGDPGEGAPHPGGVRGKGSCPAGRITSHASARSWIHVRIMACQPRSVLEINLLRGPCLSLLIVGCVVVWRERVQVLGQSEANILCQVAGLGVW